MLESKFQKKVIKILKATPNLWFWKVQAGSIRGIPDLVGCYEGRMFMWELKKSKQEGMLTTGRAALQKYRLVQVRRAGGIGEMVYPQNLEEKYKELTGLDLPN